jgi:2,5-dihydroxypyridine 5,6-dioxygenase
MVHTVSDRLGTDLVPLFTEELRLCRVEPGETVLVLSDSLSPPAYETAILGAARALGAHAVALTLPLGHDLQFPPLVARAWQSADLAVPLFRHRPWLYSDAHNEALASGTRSLMVQEPPDILRRLLPHPDVRRRSEAGAARLGRATTIRLHSDAGTDLVLRKDGRTGIGQYGVADVAGRWDHWPSGLVACAPLEGSAEGTLVLDRGDIVLNLGRYVTDPVTMTLEEGRITRFDGGTDAVLLREFFAKAGDDKAYVVSHVGWGTEHRALWHLIGHRFAQGGGVMDAESYLGNMQIAFGSNFASFLGGSNRTSFHIDLPTRNHSIWLDDELVVERGTIVPADLR